MKCFTRIRYFQKYQSNNVAYLLFIGNENIVKINQHLFRFLGEATFCRKLISN